jgi:limonene-1,2-epoxide hydrolase
MADPISVVREFCAAWDRRDREAILAAFTDDAVYHNMPMEPAKGKDAVRGLVDFVLSQGPEGISFEIRDIAAAGTTVLTERVDTFRQGAKRITLEVMGAFDVRDGKIAAWRDYFDMARWTKQIAG